MNTSIRINAPVRRGDGLDQLDAAREPRIARAGQFLPENEAGKPAPVSTDTPLLDALAALEAQHSSLQSDIAAASIEPDEDPGPGAIQGQILGPLCELQDQTGNPKLKQEIDDLIQDGFNIGARLHALQRRIAKEQERIRQHPELAKTAKGQFGEELKQIWNDTHVLSIQITALTGKIAAERKAKLLAEHEEIKAKVRAQRKVCEQLRDEFNRAHADLRDRKAAAKEVANRFINAKANLDGIDRFASNAAIRKAQEKVAAMEPEVDRADQDADEAMRRHNQLAGQLDGARATLQLLAFKEEELAANVEQRVYVDYLGLVRTPPGMRADLRDLMDGAHSIREGGRKRAMIPPSA